MVRRQKKNKTIVWLTVAIAIIMVTSIAGYFTDEMTEKKRYGRYSFTVREDGIYTQVNSTWLKFRYYPDKLQEIPLDKEVMAQLMQARAVMITFEPGAEDGATVDLLRLEMSKEMPALFGTYVVMGVTNNSNLLLPEVTCQNATSYMPVLYLKDTGNVSVTAQDGCIILQGDKQGLAIAKDRLYYTYLGILNATA
ncbi:MAG: hypothetical protein V1735_02900 [Nanoarchaeota archaeon]